MKTSFTGWVFQYHGMTVYFGGDTAYDGEQVQEDRRALPDIDVALLPSRRSTRALS